MKPGSILIVQPLAMKTTATILAFVVVSAVSTAAEPAIGATFAEVRSTLGLPKAKLQRGERMILLYDRGEVELNNGAVSRIALRSEVAQAAHEAKVAAREARVREESEQRRSRLLDEGKTLLAAKQADARFNEAPLTYQVSFWEEFSRKYAGVDCREPLTIARLKLAEQVEARREREQQAARLAELEARLAEAETRASYASYFGRSYGRRGRDRHDDRPFTMWPVEYRYYDSPQPYATSPNLPILNLPQPVSSYEPRRGHPGRGHGHGRGRDRCL